MNHALPCKRTTSEYTHVVLTLFLTNAREHQSVKSLMDQRAKQLCRPVRPVWQPVRTSIVGFGSRRSFEEDNYHSYVMEDD
jgi:hypothetical protein